MDAGMRSSQAERDSFVDSLRDHAAEGRLEVGELEERVGAALRARTRGELEALTADLPRRRSQPHRRQSDGVALARVFAPIALLLVAIWGLTGMGYFWPVWPLMGFTIAVVAVGGSCSPARKSARRQRPAL